MSVSVTVRFCIYADGHEGPCVTPSGDWHEDLPSIPLKAGVMVYHLGSHQSAETGEASE